MFILKYLVLTLFVFIGSCLSKSLSETNETAEILWNLSKFAIQSRQYRGKYPYPYSYKYPGKYPQYYQNYPINSQAQYPGSTYLNSHHQKPYYHSQKQYSNYYQSKPTPSYLHNHLGQKIKQSLMDVLNSIAQNDDLQCVPKIICEVTSGVISSRQQGVNVPININMESILRFVSALNGVQTSPLFHFGKAALQGYTSKGNTGSCNYAYPDCPSDPEKLVQYLNNHNGGFFRFFNGISPQNYPSRPQLEYNPSHFRQNPVAEQRIQNNAIDYVGSNFRKQKETQFPNRDELNFDGTRLTFPNEDSNVYHNEVKLNKLYLIKAQNLLKFPEEQTLVNYHEQPFRKPKELPYDLSYYYPHNDLDLQKPLPNHKASPMIFPDRTGTGELRLDTEEWRSREPLSYEDTGVKITFTGFNVGKDENKYHFTSNKYSTSGYAENGRGFSFPSR